MGNKPPATMASKSADPDADREGNLSKALQTKIRIMGALSHDHRMRVEERADLYRALAELKEDRRRLSYDLEQERLNRMSKSLHVTDSTFPDPDKPSWTAYENDKNCAICHKPAKRTQEYPCRVCTRIFHKLCLSKCGECRNADLKAAEHALSNAGWSCYFCGNLSLLLAEEEINQLIDEFDMYDSNKDEHVSWQEFNARTSTRTPGVRSGQRGDRGSIDSELDRRLDFKMADQDDDDSLDWWEFLNHRAKPLLGKRSKEELVSLLTEKEIIKAKTLFKSMDSDKDGVLTLLEAKQAVRQSCQRFTHGLSQDELNDLMPRINLHSDVRAQMFVDSDNKKRESVTWPEFLAQQALYIISTRPNVSASNIENAIRGVNLRD